jgi:hypothetical protein
MWVVPQHVVIRMSNYDATEVFKDPIFHMRCHCMRFIDGPHLDPASRYSRWEGLLYSLPISQCTPLHSRAGGLAALTQSRSEARIIQSRPATAAMNRVAWCNSATHSHVEPAPGEAIPEPTVTPGSSCARYSRVYFA